MAIAGQSREAAKPDADIYDSSYLEWKTWDGRPFGHFSKVDGAYFRQELKKIGGGGAPIHRVLEIGFGNGSFLGFARAQGWSACGTEANPLLVDIAAQAGFDARPASDLATFAPGSFGLVVAIDVLEHIPRTEILDFLAAVKTLLGSGGHFLARFPNGDSPFGLRNQNGDLSHLTAIGINKARYLAQAAGMEIIALGGEARPIVWTRPRDFAHQLVEAGARKALNGLYNHVFSYQDKIDFFSSNTTMILRAPENPRDLAKD